MTSLLTVKLRRDLQATWTRIALMVVAIAVSLAAFSAVLNAWTAIARETEQAYLSTDPASATIRFDPAVDAEQMAAIERAARDLPNVIEATGRTQFTTDIAVNGQLRELQLQVFVAAPDDPMRMANFEVENGAWPPGSDEIFISGDSLDLLDVRVGDTVSLPASGEPAELRVANTVYDPSLAPASQEQTGRGYLSTDSLAAVGGSAVLDQLKVQIGDQLASALPSRDRDAIVAVAARIGEWLRQEHGLAVQEIQVPEPYAHPHQGQADALLGAMLVGAGSALLLSTILVANMLAGLFAQQIPQIGIMKAIGGSSGRVARLYLAMILTIAGAATALALPVGIMAGRAFVPSAFGFLGIEAASSAPAWWTYIVVVAAGLALPVLMALVPLVRTSRTTVRAAIDHHGGGNQPRISTGFLARLSRLPAFDRGLLMAIRNTVRRPARFLLAVGLLASAGMMFIAGVSARDGMQAVADESNDQLSWDVTVQLEAPAPAADVIRLVEQMPQVRRVEGWTITSASVSEAGQLPISRTYPDQGHGRLTVTAVPAETTMFTPPALREGRWLTPDETGAIVLNQVTLANTDADLRIGDTVDLALGGTRTEWRIVGFAEERSAASRGYVTAAGLAAATGRRGAANSLRIETDQHDEQSRVSFADAVDQVLSSAGVDVRSAESVGRMEAVTGGHLEPILVILLVTALPMGVIGCIGLASTMSANVLERTREFGIMHAIGALPRAVRRLVVAEGVLVALASCLVAALPAIGMTAAIDSVVGNTFMDTPLPFRVSLTAAGIWTTLIILGAMLATDAAATRASRITVREALGYL